MASLCFETSCLPSISSSAGFILLMPPTGYFCGTFAVTMNCSRFETCSSKSSGLCFLMSSDDRIAYPLKTAAASPFR